ncbi:hypothetical protein LWI29_016292 [Acer saccharum]|uniref:Uncharacterized protein n=1 Tax=Acer saccharum TaxID=4024 RepID=A0AA39RK41_ACESA|nr:hypothetical protein LWI29_016292 [Acer saccharum]
MMIELSLLEALSVAIKAATARLLDGLVHESHAVGAVLVSSEGPSSILDVSAGAVVSISSAISMVGQGSKVNRDSVSPLVSFAQPIVSSVVSVDELDDRVTPVSSPSQHDHADLTQVYMASRTRTDPQPSTQTDDSPDDATSTSAAPYVEEPPKPVPGHPPAKQTNGP